MMAGRPALALTLNDALAAVYKDNPTLTGQRAQLRATDEGVAIARASGRPTLGASANFAQGLHNYQGLNSYNRQFTAGVTATVPIFQGGRVRNAIKAADRRVDQGRADLRATEGDVFTETVGAYMDVLRDRKIVELNINNLRVLQTNLEATDDQFQAGSLTRTDVAQSQARLELGKSQLAAARAAQVTSEENFLRVIGFAADGLDQPPNLPLMPGTGEQAATTAVENNPDIASADAAIKAAAYDVSAARAQAMPSVSGQAFGNRYDLTDPLPGLGSLHTNTASAGVTLTVPLYQGGAVSAQVRQAQALQSQAIEQRTAIERQVVANARAYYSSYLASLDTIRSSEEAVKANTLALEGVRAEQSAGLRQVLDVLNAEQELLNSQVTLATSQRDAYVAGFALLNVMGYVNYQKLGIEGGALYDPTLHYKRSVNTLSDFADDPTPTPVAHSTYGPPPPASENPLVTPPRN